MWGRRVTIWTIYIASKNMIVSNAFVTLTVATPGRINFVFMAIMLFHIENNMLDIEMLLFSQFPLSPTSAFSQRI